jgi:putative membrane protein
MLAAHFDYEEPAWFFEKASTYMMWGYYDGGGMAWWMILSSLVWIGLAAVAVWALVSWLGRASRGATPPQMPSQPSALDILNTRYARGEIDTTTYQSIREQLEAPSATSPKALPSGQ